MPTHCLLLADGIPSLGVEVALHRYNQQCHLFVPVLWIEHDQSKGVDVGICIRLKRMIEQKVLLGLTRLTLEEVERHDTLTNRRSY